MSKASQVIVLCEGKLDEVVASRFLRKSGVSPHAIRVMPYPGGQGSGAEHVRANYPDQLKAFRQRSAKAKTALIVMTDADNLEVSQRRDELDAACSSADPAVPCRKGSEVVAFIIPRRHIETWLAFLDGQDVDEHASYKPQYEYKRKESQCHPLVDGLAKDCNNSKVRDGMPESLRLACEEFEKIKDALGN